ncbi:Transcription factor spt8 [Massospora cicadina]|nr:Transcription factor spt8 [Massospora cicadina]
MSGKTLKRLKSELAVGFSTLTRSKLASRGQTWEDKDGFIIPTTLPKHPMTKLNRVGELKRRKADPHPASYEAKARSHHSLVDDVDLVDRSFQVIPVAATLLPSPINSLGHSDDMRWVLLGAEDAYIRKYDFFASMNGKLPLTQAHRHATVDVCSRSGVLMSYWDNQVYQPDPTLRPAPSSGEAFDNQFSPAHSLYLHSRALWCLSGLTNGEVNLYTVRHDEGACHHAFKGHTANVSVIKTFDRETKAITGAWDKKIVFWDLHTGANLQELTSHANQICSIHLQPEAAEGMLLTSSVDGRSLLWDLRAGNPAAPDCPRWTTSTCFDRAGRIVYTGRRNGTVDGVDIRMNRLARTLRLPPNSGPVSQVLAHPTRNFLLCGSFDNLRVWNLDLNADATGGAFKSAAPEPTFLSPYQLVPGHQTGTISQMAIDANGKYLITTSGCRGWEGTSTNTALFYEIKIL